MKIVKDKGVEGKVCVVTGAAGVLCSSMTEDLLKHGAKVAVLDLRGDVAKQFCAKLAKKGLTQTLAIEANVLDKASLEAARDVVLKKWKRIDVLINGAGGNHPKGTTPALRPHAGGLRVRQQAQPHRHDPPLPGVLQGDAQEGRRRAELLLDGGVPAPHEGGGLRRGEGRHHELHELPRHAPRADGHPRERAA